MITINGKQYKLKYTIRAMMIFEQVSKKHFSIETITDEYLYLYCMIMANNPDATIDFNDLLDAIDNDPSILQTFRKVLEDYSNKQQLLSNPLEDDAASKKNS